MGEFAIVTQDAAKSVGGRSGCYVELVRFSTQGSSLIVTLIKDKDKHKHKYLHAETQNRHVGFDERLFGLAWAWAAELYV
jgi:hypothetical protein